MLNCGSGWQAALKKTNPPLCKLAREGLAEFQKQISGMVRYLSSRTGSRTGSSLLIIVAYQ